MSEAMDAYQRWAAGKSLQDVIDHSRVDTFVAGYEAAPSAGEMARRRRRDASLRAERDAAFALLRRWLQVPAVYVGDRGDFEPEATLWLDTKAVLGSPDAAEAAAALRASNARAAAERPRGR